MDCDDKGKRCNYHATDNLVMIGVLSDRDNLLNKRELIDTNNSKNATVKRDFVFENSRLSLIYSVKNECRLYLSYVQRTEL